MNRSNPLFSNVLFVLVLAWFPLAIATADDRLEFFEHRIRPVLVEHCYECHSSGQTAEAGLVLDHRDALRRGGDAGSLLATPVQESLLLKVIRHEIVGLEMPEGGLKLADQVIADFQRWIEDGAIDPRDGPPPVEELAQATSWQAIRDKRTQWWSFQPITQPEIPPVQAAAEDENQHWSQFAVDRFTRAKMNAAGLSPASQAERSTLARRLSFALTGLPPTPEQVSHFVDDPSPHAYDSLVDQWLDSPHFGERWARHWMDWIRYAESHGSEGDPRIDGAHYYRDYLIRAFNDDVPYDQLVREHIAGDLLEKPRLNHELAINESQLATAHWRMVFHGFAPTDALEEKMRFTDDAIDVYSKAFLGLTVSCARCHDHKFDAISQADYYALFGVLGSTRPGRAAIDTPERLSLHRKRLERLKGKMRHAIASDWLASLDQFGDRWNAVAKQAGKTNAKRTLVGMYAQLQDAADPAHVWQRHVNEQRQTVGAAKRSRQGSVRHWNLSIESDHKAWFSYGNGTADRVSSAGEFAIEVTGEAVLQGIFSAGVYSHLISDKHAAILTSPDFTLEREYDLWLKVAGGGSAMSRYVVQGYPRKGTVYPITELKNDQGAQWQWQRYDLSYWKGDKIHIELVTAKDAAVQVIDQDRSWFGIQEAIVVPRDGFEPSPPELEFWQALLDQVADQTPLKSTPQYVRLVEDTIRGAIEAWQADQLTDAQASLLNQCLAEGHLPNTLSTLPTASPLVAHYRRLENEIPVPRRVPTLAEWQGADQPLLQHGDHKRPANAVPRRFLEVIDETPYVSPISGRLELAEDLIREDNPLTARVIVNRIWHHLFGRGIVGTNNNFGRLGQTPTHPELLDYLAHQFRTVDGWSIKKMIRRLVTSHTWRQSSQPSPRAQEIDPQNQCYSYFSVQRLEAEAIRDAMLVMSGQWDATMFGPAVKGSSSRRSVYVNVIRNSLDPFLATFDAPVPFSSKGRRDVTNVPAQSLLMMNDPFVIAKAKQFADRAGEMVPNGDAQARVNWLWQNALGRLPDCMEIETAMSYLSQSEQAYADLLATKKQIQTQLQESSRAVQRLQAAVVSRMEATTQGNQVLPRDTLPRPIAQWQFDQSADDVIGNTDLELFGTAKLDDGALRLDGNGWASSGAIDGVTLIAKSIAATVMLDDLDQKGGGVMTIQNLGSDVFDSIVFAERMPGQWISGSNRFARTRDFGGPPEQSAGQAVHLCITYDDQGQITCYRDGQPYGQPFQSDLQTFQASDFQVLFGMRHGKSVSGNRMLRGRVLGAALFDRALSPSEVATIAANQSSVISPIEIAAALNARERKEWERLKSRVRELASRLESKPADVEPEQHWIDFAHSILNMKEFIYVR